MKKNCNVIRDLLPLYIDDVCSKESKDLVREHLEECNDCREELEKLNTNINTSKFDEVNVFKKFAKKINFKIIRRVFLCTSIIFVIAVGVSRFCSTYKFNLEYDDRMKIIVHANDKRWNFQFMAPIAGVSFGKVVTINENGENVNLVFVDWKVTIDGYLHSEGGGTVPEMNYQNTNFNEKMRVYYTKENLKEIDNASEEELNNIINNSKLIFTNEKVTSSISCTLNNQDYHYSLTYYKVNKQIIDSEGDSSMPDELLNDIYGIDGHFRKLWFGGFDTSDEVFNNIEEYMTNNGGVCTREEV